MKAKIILFFIALAVLAGGGWFGALSFQEGKKPILRVMTYASFAGVFGPGESLKKEFEKQCACRVKWLKVPDSTLFSARLKLKKDGFKTDVVMGVDQLSLKILKNLPWKPLLKSGVLSSPPGFSIPKLELPAFARGVFVPYDWSPMTFLSRKPMSFYCRGLCSFKQIFQLKQNLRVSLPSPRLSTVGLQFLYWVWVVFQKEAASFLKDFRSQLYGLPSSWSTSYALFQRGHVDLSFSYLSSLLYHQSRGPKDFYPLVFKEGHAFQAELAGVSGFCRECALAQRFLKFLLTPKAQNILFQKNYMLPVLSLKPSQRFLKAFPSLKLISYKDQAVFLKQKEQWLKIWE